MRAVLRRLVLGFLALATLSWPVQATWSIVVVDRRTGEVAVGGATCLANTDLLELIPAVAVGVGAGCIQSRGDAPALVTLYDGLVRGDVPPVVMEDVKSLWPNPGAYQVGIVAFRGRPKTFTGGQAGRAAGGVFGQVGDFAYAIQGNVLTGPSVWLGAEAALLTTPGDLATKMMAAMEAARAAGGDGRCSCDLGRPTSCGDPPTSFEKSAHCGFLVVARHGDQDSPCVQGPDCASGDYYLKLNIRGRDSRNNAPDPVLQLQNRFDAWRTTLVGEPDAILSEVVAVQAVPADGRTRRTVTIRLRDVNGEALVAGGDQVRVETEDGGPPLASLTPVTDHGDGSYSFELTAPDAIGAERLIVTALANGRRIHLYPYLDVAYEPVAPLHVGYREVRASTAPDVPFLLDVPSAAGQPYVVLASLSGTSPGTVVGGVPIPLNTDGLTWSTLLRAGDPNVLPGTIGVLDGLGRAEASLSLRPRQMLYLSGLHLDWAGLVFGGPQAVATNPVGFDVVP